MSLLSKYESKVANGLIKFDQGQIQVVEKLQALCNIITQTRPRESNVRLWERVFRRPAPLIGMYLYGGVGSGKTMLMDLFHSNCPVPNKRRTHFSSFMLDIHARMHQIKSERDPLKIVAQQVADEMRVVCLDEFQVVDVADAMVLRNLMEVMMERGVYFLMTSNRHPRELYLNGIQRNSFLPCIDLIEKRLDVVNLTGEEDYRKRQSDVLEKIFYSPINDETGMRINKTIEALCNGQKRKESRVVVML